MNRLEAWRKLRSLPLCLVCGTRMIEVNTGRITCACNASPAQISAVIERLQSAKPTAPPEAPETR